MVKTASWLLISLGSAIISYFVLTAYGFGPQFILSIIAILIIGLGVFMGQNE